MMLYFNIFQIFQQQQQQQEEEQQQIDAFFAFSFSMQQYQVVV